MENVKYREKDDILVINMGEKAQESIPRGGFVVDISSQGKVTGVEILDASQTLSELLDENPEIIRKILINMEEAEVVTTEVKGISFMVLRITSVENGQRKETKLPMEIPQPVTT